MAKVYEFLADGFEEVEALAPVDILRRGGVDIATVSINDSLNVKTSHGVTVVADMTIADFDVSEADLLVLPGGMPGATNLLNCKAVCEALLKQNAAGKNVAAICAAPLVLGHLGILKGKNATCYPGFETHLEGATYTAEMVTVDGNTTTGRGPGAAMEFGYTLLSQFVPKEKVEELKAGMIYKG